MQRFLVAESESADEREARRAHTGQSSGESYADTLRQMAPDAAIEICQPADAEAPVFSPDDLTGFDAVFLTGSPLHVYDDTPEVKRQLAFMRAVFASGTPSFGSCAGLQVATAAAGGRVRKMPERMEAGLSRRIVATGEGQAHPLLAGRAATWDAPAIHGDEVEELPPGATLLAGNAVTRVQAAEIRHDKGVFWGVQYHPELSLREIAVAMRRQAAELVEAGLADEEGEVDERARVLDALHDAPERRSLRWRLGVDGELAGTDARRREIGNFLRALPTIDRRGAR
ncbi:type 1 glutamine amidotransferase [uncultured Sphingomonas sp.]|uniref:type 1 glutamine amidotransferase n=1 Tax=uncultured Sphingomonas sp. TaxID=158754 RepID=UPI003749ECD4